METQIETYIQSKGWDFKFIRGEYSLSDCPLNGCGQGHFYINQEKETFYCHKCNERGTFLNLKNRLGDIPKIPGPGDYFGKRPEKTISPRVVEKRHQELLGNPAALAYLQDERGFTLETIKKFKLGFENGNITTPYFRDGDCLNIKSRPIKRNGGSKYFREEGCPSILFNVDNAKKHQGAVIITEGEFDAIAYDQLGFSNVVSVPSGAGNFSEEWIDDLESFPQIYFSYDMDPDGRKGLEKAVDRVGRYRCLNVLLPLKDANDCLKAGITYQEMTEYLAKAKPFDLAVVKSVEDFKGELIELFEGKSSRGIQTGWKELDNLLGGLRPGELTIVTGETSSGKTTWTANLNFNLTKKGYPVLAASFEMKPVTVLKKMVQMEKGTPFRDMRKHELEDALNRISGQPIRFVDHYGEMDLGKLKDAIYYSRRRYGVEVVIIDHLHFFLKYSADQERQAIDSAIRDMKAWAMELGVHIILIVHPTKLSDDNRVVRLNDLKGSSGLKQIPDNVISIWRDMKQDSGSLENEIVLYILKCRDDSGNTGEVILNFNKKSQGYTGKP